MDWNCSSKLYCNQKASCSPPWPGSQFFNDIISCYMNLVEAFGNKKMQCKSTILINGNKDTQKHKYDNKVSD